LPDVLLFSCQYYIIVAGEIKMPSRGVSPEAISAPEVAPRLDCHAALAMTGERGLVITVKVGSLKGFHPFKNPLPLSFVRRGGLRG